MILMATQNYIYTHIQVVILFLYYIYIYIKKDCYTIAYIEETKKYKKKKKINECQGYLVIWKIIELVTYLNNKLS